MESAKISFSNIPASKESISAFAELVELADRPLDDELMEKVSIAKSKILSTSDKRAIIVELESNRPRRISKGTVGEEIFAYIDEVRASIGTSSRSPNVSNSSSPIVIDLQPNNAKSEGEYEFSIKYASSSSDTDNIVKNKVTIGKIEVKKDDTESESKESTNTSSPSTFSSFSSSWSSTKTEDGGNLPKPSPKHKDKDNSSLSYVAMILIVIAIIIVIGIVCYALYMYMSTAVVSTVATKTSPVVRTQYTSVVTPVTNVVTPAYMDNGDTIVW